MWYFIYATYVAQNPFLKCRNQGMHFIVFGKCAEKQSCSGY